MRKFVTIAVVMLASAAPVRAAGLSLGTGENLTWNLADPSPTFNVSVLNPGGAVTDPVIAWQLGLAIVPEGGATGTVSIGNFSAPVDYLLAGDSSGISEGSPGPMSPVQHLYTDVANDSGVPVPSSGANLLAITFSQITATGVFDIVTYGDSVEGSYWISGNDQTFTPQAFDNVPFPPNGFPGEPVLLGTLTIQGAAVPEPHSAFLIACGGAGIVMFVRGRRRTKRS
jgi:hypothetical protein